MAFSSRQANAAAASVLFSPELKSAFYKLLGFLSVFDAVFLLSIVGHLCTSGGSSASLAGAFVFFHFAQSASLVASIYMTVGLALERYLAISRPLEHVVVMQVRFYMYGNWKQ